MFVSKIKCGYDYLHRSIRLDRDEDYDIIKKHGSLLDVMSSSENDTFNMSNSNVKVICEKYCDIEMKRNVIDEILISFKEML